MSANESRHRRRNLLSAAVKTSSLAAIQHPILIDEPSSLPQPFSLAVVLSLKVIPTRQAGSHSSGKDPTEGDERENPKTVAAKTRE